TIRKAGRASIVTHDDLVAWIKSLPARGKPKSLCLPRDGRSASTSPSGSISRALCSPSPSVFSASHIPNYHTRRSMLSPPVDARFGTRGSMAVNYKDGKWFDHENQVGGGVLDLISEKAGRSKSEALEWLKEQEFYAGALSHQSCGRSRSRPAAIRSVGKI